MSKNIAELVVKMKSKSLIDIETTGDGASQVFMAAVAVANTVADGGKGNRKKAEAIMTVAKDIIDGVFETVWKREYGDTPAASEPAVKTEKQDDPAAARPGDMDSMIEKNHCRRNETGKGKSGSGAGRNVQSTGRRECVHGRHCAERHRGCQEAGTKRRLILWRK